MRLIYSPFHLGRRDVGMAQGSRRFVHGIEVLGEVLSGPMARAATKSDVFNVDGAWDLVMHGPDGTDYQEWISWTEIAPPERIALLHGESRDDPNAFTSVLTFEPDRAATRIEMHTVLRTKELRDEAVEKYHAIEGGQQTLSNLACRCRWTGSSRPSPQRN